MSQTVTADFDPMVADPICVPVSIPFSNNSTGATEYSWTVNGTFFSTEENPERVFTSAGAYEICLTASNASNSDTHCITVEVNTGPNISFTTDVTSGCPPLDVVFNIVSPDTDIVDLVWDFGDGSFMNSTETTISHSYLTASIYDVNLTATNADGCTTFIFLDDLITVDSDITPQFSADATSSCEAPLTVNFTNTTIGIPNGATYLWDFGDGTTSTNENPTYTYNTTGNNDVSLTITNPQTGCSNTTTISNFINIGGEAMFSFIEDNSGSCNEKTVTFTDETIGDVVIYAWDFGDGTTSNLQSPVHVYSTIGCHTPSLTVTTTSGCVVSYESTECIEILEEVALSYTASQSSSCQPPLTVDFSTDYTGDILWDFGGLGDATEQNPTFTFDEFGSYPITLTATLPSGCEYSIATTIIEIHPPQPTLSADILEGCAPLDVNFEDISSIDGNIVEWLWDLGDGTTSTEQNPSHTYVEHGSYDVSLSVMLDNGCTGITSWTNYIQAGYIPNADFEGDPRETCIENLIGFTDLSDDENIDFWWWDFGDGSASDQQHPLHEYNDTGWFDVTLTVGYNSCYDTLVFEDYMHLFPPKAVFTFEQECSDPGMITFTDSSIGADSWFWTFGDGGTSTEQHPTHFYSEPGQYAVNLEVYNEESGCTDDLGSGLIIQHPMASFTVDPMEVCMSGNEAIVSITNTSTDAVDFIWYAPGVFVIKENAEDIHPDLRFTSPGIYTGMTLTAIDAAGCEDVFVFEDTITVSNVTSSFTYELIDFDCGQVFQFNDTSVAEFTEIISWEWDFGDGVTSTEQNPTHMYPQGGNYEPTLTVTTASGCVHTKVCPNPLHVEAPFVAFDVDENICLGDVSSFTNNSIASEFITWEWDFGDGNTSTEWSPNHTYNSGGTYKACFTATNADACSGMSCINISVEEISIDFTADEFTATCNPHVVQFSNLSENAVSWTWDFGDNSGLSTLQNPTHTFINSGNFEICLTVESPSGCTETLCKENYIQIGGPVGEITYDPGNEGCTDFTVDFNMTGTNIHSYVLDFGDGATESDNNVSANNFSFEHTYTEIGAFTPVLLLSDDQGCDNFILLDTIYTQSLSVAFDATEKEFCAGSVTDFTTTINASHNIQSIEWTFEGGTPASSMQENPTGISYDEAGSFDVTLTVSLGHCSETIIKENFITVHPAPALAFNANPSVGCGPTTVHFENNSTIDSGNIANYFWDFGNGEISDLPNPSSHYDSTGTYTVTLVAESNEGCRSESSQIINIYEAAQAEIFTDEYVLCQGQEIELEGIVSGTPSWSPSNGLSCTACPNPIANPSITTTYYLTATTENGCIATDSIIVERVNVAPPTITLTAQQNICPGDKIQIIATGGENPFDYQWDTTVPGLTCYENCSNPIVEIFETSTFTVNVSNSYDCISTDSITINVVGSDLEILGPDRTICEGDNIELAVLGGANPIWEGNPDLSCLDCAHPIVSPNETTTYTVQVEYESCVINRDITVFVISPEEVNAGEDIRICNGQTTTLQGDAPGDFTWKNNGSVFETENLNPEISPNSNTTYILTATNDLCILSDTVEVIVDDKVQLIADDIESCEGSIVQLSVTGDNITSYEWNHADLLNANDVPNPTATVHQTTTFTVTAESDVCNSNTTDVTVFIQEGPEVLLPEAQSFVPGSAVTLSPLTDGDGTYTYNWSPNRDISCTNCANPSVSPDSTTLYIVEISNEWGCVTTDSVLLKPLYDCLENIVIVPTGFSPNGDGKNDKLRVLGLAEIQLFRVYNRWGELMFETTNPSEGWDGTFKSRPVNTDVFVWYVEAICPVDGSIISAKGDVTLLK